MPNLFPYCIAPATFNSQIFCCFFCGAWSMARGACDPSYHACTFCRVRGCWWSHSSEQSPIQLRPGFVYPVLSTRWGKRAFHRLTLQAGRLNNLNFESFGSNPEVRVFLLRICLIARQSRCSMAFLSLHHPLPPISHNNVLLEGRFRLCVAHPLLWIKSIQALRSSRWEVNGGWSPSHFCKTGVGLLWPRKFCWKNTRHVWHQFRLLDENEISDGIFNNTAWALPRHENSVFLQFWNEEPDRWRKKGAKVIDGNRIPCPSIFCAHHPVERQIPVHLGEITAIPFLSNVFTMVGHKSAGRSTGWSPAQKEVTYHLEASLSPLRKCIHQKGVCVGWSSAHHNKIHRQQTILFLLVRTK